MNNSDSMTPEQAHSFWGVERYINLIQLATTMFNEWVANPEREDDTWYGEEDFDINLYDNDDGKRKAVLYYMESDAGNRQYDKFITIVEQTYAPLGYTDERFNHIKEYARKELVDFMAGTRERTYRGETWDDDYELCFDTEEDDINAITIELYRRYDDGVDFSHCHHFTVEELTKNAQ